jgi:hypothetical protein
MFLDLPDPDPSSFCTDPDSSIIKKNKNKSLDDVNIPLKNTVNKKTLRS